MSIINLKFLADTTQLDAAKNKMNDLGSAGGTAGNAVDGVAEAFNALKNPVALAVAGLAAAIAGCVKLGFEAINAADNLNDLVVQTGRAGADLQAMDAIARKSGGSLDGLLKVFDKVAKGMAKGNDETTKFNKALDFFGVSSTDSAGKLKTQEQISIEVAEAYNKMGNSSSKAAAAQEIFGNGAKAQIPTLLSLKEKQEELNFQKQVGADMDTNLAKASDDYNDTLVDLGTIFKGLGNDMARIMLPLLQGVASALKTSATEGGLLHGVFTGLKVIIGALAYPVKWLVTLFDGVSTAVQVLGQGLGGVALMLVNLFQGNFAEVKNVGVMMMSEIDDISSKFAERNSKMYEDLKKGKSLVPASAGQPPDPNGTFTSTNTKDKPKVETEAEKAEKAIQQLIKSQQGELNALKELTAYDKIRIELKDKQYKLASAGAKDYAIQLSYTIDQMQQEKMVTEEIVKLRSGANGILDSLKKETDQRLMSADAIMRENAEKKINLDFEEAMAKIKRNVGGYEAQETRLIEAKTEALEKLNEALDDYASKQTSWLYGAQSAFAAYGDSASQIANQSENAFANAFQGMEDALVKFAMTGKLSFGDLARSIIADLIRIQAKAAVSGIMKFAMMAYGGFSGGSSIPDLTADDLGQMPIDTGALTNMDWTSGIKVGSANGNVFNGGSLMAFANGGVVSSPTTFPMSRGTGLMGESGPEAIMPLSRGANGKLGVQMSGGSSAGISIGSIVVNVQGGKTNEETGAAVSKAMVDTMKGIANQQIANSGRPGGLGNPFSTRAF